MIDFADMLEHSIHGVGFEDGVLHLMLDNGTVWEFEINGKEVRVTVWPEEANLH